MTREAIEALANELREKLNKPPELHDPYAELLGRYRWNLYMRHLRNHRDSNAATLEAIADWFLSGMLLNAQLAR